MFLNYKFCERTKKRKKEEKKFVNDEDFSLYVNITVAFT